MPGPSRKYWYVKDRIGCGMFTTTDYGVIVETPPLWRRWRGEYIDRLPYYFEVEEMPL